MRLKWDLEGDHNSAFFHSCVNSKQKKLHIHRIHKEDGTCIYDMEDIKTEFVSFYSNLYQKASMRYDTQFLSTIPPLISHFDNVRLMASPILEEVEGLVKSTDSNSSVGSDGFTGVFFNKCWNTIKEDMLDAVLCFFGGFGYP